MTVYSGFSNQAGVCGYRIPDILTTGKYIESASLSLIFPEALCVFQIFVAQFVSHGRSGFLTFRAVAVGEE